MNASTSKHLLVTGGAGYIGSLLVPTLIDRGHTVTVYDRLIFGQAALEPLRGHSRFRLAAGDICDSSAMDALFSGHAFDAVIHLAAISNDPSSELDPQVTRRVNRDAVSALMQRAKAHGVGRFLYASSASVYGIKETADVTEDLPLEPITLYAECKARGEGDLRDLVDDAFIGVAVRAATVCGFSPRLRLDLTINILTDQALSQGKLRVFGGGQMRPNIHIRDLVDFYLLLLEAPAMQVNGRAFNVCHNNATVLGLAEMIRDEVDPRLPIDIVPTDDLRSYHLSAAAAARELGFRATRPLTTAVRELRAAYQTGQVPDPTADIYRNVAWMKAHPARWQQPGQPQ